RGDAEPDNVRGATRRCGCAGLDPAPDQPVLLAVLVEALAAAVGNAAGRLHEQEALRRGGGKDAPAARLAGDGLMVEGGVKAEQRQLEAVLPARLAVTAAGIAAELAQDGDDLGLEINRPALAETADADIDCDLVASVADSDLRGAVAGRGDVTVFVNLR